MKAVCVGLICLMVLGCSPILKKGDYVKYRSDEYVFIENDFIDKSMDCIYLEKMKEDDLGTMYCLGTNYASQFVEGFIFEHLYKDINERLIGSTLSFQVKGKFAISCSSETIDGKSSGKEYINCMMPRKSIDMYALIMSSNKDIETVLRARVGDERVYKNVFDRESKVLLHKFYKDRAQKNIREWKSKKL